MDTKAATACVLIIGNEILSGKTQDTNLQFLGAELAKKGITLVEARVLRDDKDAIVAAVNECRAAYTYVFTTGGIGPTHDDITAGCIAAAFGRDLVLHEEAVQRLRRRGLELNAARLKMAHVPEGASLIDNPLSGAPGFRIENVFVMAGIPAVARGMFSTLDEQLSGGAPIHSRNVDVYLPEGELAAPLETIVHKYPQVEIGSYPFFRESRYGANLVVRGTDEKLVEQVLRDIIATMSALGGETG